MTKEELNKLTDDELLNEKRKMKNNKIINAVLIGFCFGVIIWSVAKNTWGVFNINSCFIHL